MNYQDMRVKYLFVDLRYPAYLRLQIGLFIAWIALGIALIPFRDSQVWLLANAWWLCPVIAVGEALESVVAITAAKKKYAADHNVSPATYDQVKS